MTVSQGPPPPITDLGVIARGLDRWALDRTHERVAERWRSPTARVVPLRGGMFPFALADGAPALCVRPAGDAEVGVPPAAMWLGRAPTGADLFAISETSETDAPLAILADILPTGSQVDHAGATASVVWGTVRDLPGPLPEWQLEAAVTATALGNWHRTHQRCPRCGDPTRITPGGWTRVCDADGSEHFPRTDPAVICLVRDAEDRALLARSARWPPGRMSTLAGFVEPGESLEAAVIREIEEEVGIRVREPRYLGSQPWPFPTSLMLGFHAIADGQHPRPDGEEIVSAQWFSRAELRSEVDLGHVTLPPPVSIARRLIEAWWDAAEAPDERPWSR